LILEAAPGSLVYLGLRPEVEPEQLAVAASGHGIVDALQAWPVKAGQFVHVPAGTLHSIGEGITLVEVQQNSDITFRLYDWGRVGLDGEPREIHLDDGLLSIRYAEPIQGPVDPVFEGLGSGNRVAHLIDGEHYELSLHELGSYLELDTRGLAQALVLLAGELRIVLPESGEVWTMESGDTWLLPAAVGAFRLESTEAEGLARVLVVNTKA
jgi:mannose-6-phosphate isomerase